MLRTIAVLMFVAALMPTAGAAQDGPYRLIKEIPLGGDANTFWDYLSLDTEGRRLYVTANRRVIVVDVDKGAVVGETSDTTWVHGFALAPELGRGFSSNGREGTSTIVDLKTLKTIAKVPAQRNPDSILYEPGRKEVYAFNGLSNSATIYNAMSGEVVKTLPLPERPEAGQPDPAAGRVYVNIPPKNEVAVIDTATHEVVTTWPTVPCETPYSMALDAGRHRLMIGCHNRMIVVINSQNGKVISTAPIGPRVDDVVYDPETRLVFSTNGDATTTILRQDSADALTVVQTLKTQLFSRTMALDLKTHNIYLPSAQFAVPNQTWETVLPTDKMVPGTFKVLVYGMAPGRRPTK